MNQGSLSSILDVWRICTKLWVHPHSIGKRELHLARWSPGMVDLALPRVVAILVRLRNIPFHLRSRNILLALASTISKPFRLDDITESKKLLNYTWILVEVDLSKALPSTIVGPPPLSLNQHPTSYSNQHPLDSLSLLNPFYPLEACSMKDPLVPSISNYIPHSTVGEANVLEDFLDPDLFEFPGWPPSLVRPLSPIRPPSLFHPPSPVQPINDPIISSSEPLKCST